MYKHLYNMTLNLDVAFLLSVSIHTAGEWVNSTIIRRVHEQMSYWNMHISCLLFASNGSPMTYR